ncbi:hypothetical protein PVAP13_2KG332235 [Panicum virgatum]|uniref:KIB1-4 beta-propeller domain-containing protein n=1 Tax=Panicum virgatum TaxID=38727 RepID=A0A8T0WEN3_PANVG|nr:hypothetical protein PVAP13_2KG332235 [Panicum virgatum]
MDEMEGHRYWATPQGWLVMAARSSPATFHWDPFTGARISLPPDREGFLGGGGGGLKRCLLSCKPAVADPSCSLVLVVDLDQTVLWYCRPLGAGGDDGDRWRRHEYEFAAAGAETLGSVLWSMERLASVGGSFFMSLIDKVARLDFLPEPQFTVIPEDLSTASWPPWAPWAVSSTSQLVESRGSLFCVRFILSDLRMRFVAGIGVFRLDLSAQAWVRVGSLGGRAFLVHHEFGASLDPQEEAAGLKGDCIYYCMPNDKALYVYDRERGTTAFANPGSCLADRCSAKVLMPTC